MSGNFIVGCWRIRRWWAQEQRQAANPLATARWFPYADATIRSSNTGVLVAELWQSVRGGSHPGVPNHRPPARFCHDTLRSDGQLPFHPRADHSGSARDAGDLQDLRQIQRAEQQSKCFKNLSKFFIQTACQMTFTFLHLSDFSIFRFL